MNKDDYFTLRNNMLDEEFHMRIGGKVRLSDAELQVNDILMKLKAKELDVARTNTTDFPPAVHFFHAKPMIDRSEVFNMIRNMPKGKLIQHIHVTLQSLTITMVWTNSTANYQHGRWDGG